MRIGLYMQHSFWNERLAEMTVNRFSRSFGGGVAPEAPSGVWGELYECPADYYACALRVGGSRMLQTPAISRTVVGMNAVQMRCCAADVMQEKRDAAWSGASVVGIVAVVGAAAACLAKWLLAKNLKGEKVASTLNGLYGTV